MAQIINRKGFLPTMVVIKGEDVAACRDFATLVMGKSVFYATSPTCSILFRLFNDDRFLDLTRVSPDNMMISNKEIERVLQLSKHRSTNKATLTAIQEALANSKVVAEGLTLHEIVDLCHAECCALNEYHVSDAWHSAVGNSNNGTSSICNPPAYIGEVADDLKCLILSILCVDGVTGKITGSFNVTSKARACNRED